MHWMLNIQSESSKRCSRRDEMNIWPLLRHLPPKIVIPLPEHFGPFWLLPFVTASPKAPKCWRTIGVWSEERVARWDGPSSTANETVTDSDLNILWHRIESGRSFHQKPRAVFHEHLHDSTSSSAPGASPPAIGLLRWSASRVRQVFQWRRLNYLSRSLRLRHRPPLT